MWRCCEAMWCGGSPVKTAGGCLSTCCNETALRCRWMLLIAEKFCTKHNSSAEPDFIRRPTIMKWYILDRFQRNLTKSAGLANTYNVWNLIVSARERWQLSRPRLVPLLTESMSSRRVQRPVLKTEDIELSCAGNSFVDANELQAIGTHTAEKIEVLSNISDIKSCRLVTSHDLLNASRHLLVPRHLVC